MISAIVRVHNEGQWLNRCLRAIAHQRQPVDEVVIVDNESSDNSLEIAESYGAKIVHITKEDFTFGRALNVGIDMARNEIILILSAHCVPVDEMWSSYLAGYFAPQGDKAICGVYGRQEPLPETNPHDTRDLWTTFREERQIQSSDFFFHNANSAILKKHWEQVPFDEQINGVEDRAWAKTQIRKGFKIAYEPHARVYHYHGIHHGRNEGRARRVAQSIRYVREEL